MKWLLFLLMPISFVLLIASMGLSHNNSAPNLECALCHQGDFIPEIVALEGLPEKFTPGEIYKLSLLVKSDLKSYGDVLGGFAIEASAGELIVTDEKNTQLIDGFLTHTLAGSESRVWKFAWKAPSKNVEVTFIAMAVAANGDFSSIGDIIGAGSYVLKPGK